MKENELTTSSSLDRKLRAELLLGRRVAGDRLLLADAVLGAALDGSRPLTANERAALAASPLTLRRLRQLARDRAAWSRSSGMLRAASGSAALLELATDDNCWSLHFVPQAGAWQVILKLAADAPFAPALMREQPMLRVIDGGGAILLQGRLDADGECETAWPFDSAPAPHFQQFGAVFTVEPQRTAAP
ncbi:MAG: hypothetical protein QFF03_09440 [Pseudomonadota bacterium]|nr:hypothetical protein [Pseudomonadota bacterium]